MFLMSLGQASMRSGDLASTHLSCRSNVEAGGTTFRVVSPSGEGDVQFDVDGSRCAYPYTSPLLAAEHLMKRYGATVAVQDVSLEVAAGEILGLLGPNGAGKSTTLTMLAGLLSPDSGTLRLMGHICDPRRVHLRRRLGLVPQELAFYQDMTAWENLRLFGQLYGYRGAALRERCECVLEQVGLSAQAHRCVREYSGGMKRRLNFALGILHQPAVLILDEPTVGVDPQSRTHLLQCIRQTAAQGVAVIYASHYMEEVQNLCHRVAIMDAGRILVCDTLSRLLKHGVSQIRVVTWDRRILGMETAPWIVTRGLNGDIILSWEAQPCVAWEHLRRLLDLMHAEHISVERIDTRMLDLESLFLQLTGHTLRDCV